MTDAGPHWICTACATRAAEPSTCCGEARLDVRDERVLDLLRDIDLRTEQRRETRVRFLGVGIGMAVILPLWTIPAYWTFRNAVMPLPFLADQFILMGLIAFGVIKIFGRAKKKFPFVE